MERQCAPGYFSSTFVEDRRAGYGGLELYLTTKEKKKLVARIIYWDACGQFFFETLNTELPLFIVEELIAEARAKIP
jgi:hypothetical protein